jgi:hypothetical protein
VQFADGALRMQPVTESISRRRAYCTKAAQAGAEDEDSDEDDDDIDDALRVEYTPL